MRLLPATLLVGAASAAVPPMQQVMNGVYEQQEAVVSEAEDILSKPLQKLQDHLKTLSDEARGMWEEVSNLFPHMDHTPMLSLPKKHTRRPDSHWDHIVRGADLQKIWVEGADGEKHREVGGRLEAYDLRVKKVDPSALGIDPGVKQYSGYLDDNENDKHLFYCKLYPNHPKRQPQPLNFFFSHEFILQGSSSLATTLRMTPSFFG